MEVCRRIKEASPETEVIMMTAYGTIQSTVKALHMGAYNYLTKPLDLTELMNSYLPVSGGTDTAAEG